MSLDQDRANAFLNRLVKAIPRRGPTERHQPTDRPFLQPHPTASPGRLQKIRDVSENRKKEYHENRGDVPTQSRVSGYRAETLPPTKLDRLAATAVNERHRSVNVVSPSQFFTTRSDRLPYVSGGHSDHQARGRIAAYMQQLRPTVRARIENDRSQGQDYHRGQLRRQRNREALGE